MQGWWAELWTGQERTKLQPIHYSIYSSHGTECWFTACWSICLQACCCYRGVDAYILNDILLGKELTELLLAHQSSGMLHPYSRGTGNIDLVGIRLNESALARTEHQEVSLKLN